MVERNLLPEFTIDDAVSYFLAVSDALQDDEPAKFQEFLNIFRDFEARRVDTPTVVARMEELLYDHFNLLLGLNTFLPVEFWITIPPVARKESGQFQKVVGKRLPPPKPTMGDATSYIAALKEAFHDEPAKYEEILKLLNNFKARRVDAASVIARVDELLKDHQSLLLGFSLFLSANMNSIRKPKGDGSHVVNSVLQRGKQVQK
ncbi:unnamed protein product [Arabidopsis lyrata]|nr:unnamed protein product [Arabidopsis lyrata]